MNVMAKYSSIILKHMSFAKLLCFAYFEIQLRTQGRWQVFDFGEAKNLYIF